MFDLWWGDCNGDGCINYEDVLLVSDLMNVISSSPNYNPACDLNSDRRIDNEDILLVLEMLGKTIADYPGSDMADPLP
ncbi:MAG: dockerin type I domain-containing protein [Oscillospiraceae bacterium]|nr:dockerin type I domain-containing protein [Oscillospiraceae bacterium]